ncbi:MAG: hypothetical protein KGM44_13060 [bacterium]|nr:hypothetical protein [bacterium]
MSITLVHVRLILRRTRALWISAVALVYVFVAFLSPLERKIPFPVFFALCTAYALFFGFLIKWVASPDATLALDERARQHEYTAVAWGFGVAYASALTIFFYRYTQGIFDWQMILPFVLSGCALAVVFFGQQLRG